MTMFSRLLGFARDILFAHTFGATAGFGAFLLVFKLPNLMRSLFAEGAFSQAFIPVYASYVQRGALDEARVFVGRVMGALLLAVLVVVGLVLLFSTQVVHVFAPGFTPGGTRFMLAAHLIKVIFPYLILITMAAFFSAILNTHKRFTLPAFMPCLLNIALIAAAAWAGHQVIPSVGLLAWGVIVGGVMQALILVPSMILLKQCPWPRWFFGDAGVKRVLKLMLPSVIGASVAQIGSVISNVYASFLVVGSLSWLYYSERLVYLPVGVFGVAIATVVLPNLSRFRVSDDAKGFAECLDWGVRMVLFIAAPCTCGLIALAVPLLATLFRYGAFTSMDVLATERSLIAYAFGLPAFMLVKVLSAAFFARQQPKVPVAIAVASVMLNILLCALLIHPLAHAGLALAVSLSSWFNATLLIVFAYRRSLMPWRPRSWSWPLRALIASLIMGGLLWWLDPSLITWSHWPVARRASALMGLLVLGVCTYAMMAWMMGFRRHHFSEMTRGGSHAR